MKISTILDQIDEGAIALPAAAARPGSRPNTGSAPLAGRTPRWETDS